MSWAAGDSGYRLTVPEAVREYTLERDEGLCRLRISKWCTGRAEELDHVVGVAASGGVTVVENDADNLQWVCRKCHKLKTQGQRWPTFGRQPERHPGIKR